MSNYDKRLHFYKLLRELSPSDFTLRDIFDCSSCDEIVMIDLVDDSFKQIYHIQGKYSVPTIDSLSYKKLFEFANGFVVHPDDREEHRRLMNPEGMIERLKNHEMVPNFDMAQFRYRLQDGSYRWVEQIVLCGEENRVPEGHVIFYVFDIENMKSREIGSTASGIGVISDERDHITGLLIEKAFINKARELVAAEDKKWCIVSIDIEHFKLFDEWYGRESGDLLLAKIGSLLHTGEKIYGTISGYLGQDDFAILGNFNYEHIRSLYEDIRAIIINSGFSVGFMPAIGVYLIEKGVDVADAIDRASIAASKAKTDIRNRIYIYDSEMHKNAEKEYNILSEFQVALKNDEITFFLQPQCRISTGKIVGAEALARWIRKDGSVVYPNVFIPVLEKYGFISDLDKYLWEKVCQWLRSWIDKGHIPVPVSLNISRADIYTLDVCKYLVDLTNHYKVPHEYLKIEITESAYIEAKEKILILVQNLRKNGFVVLMDDFGSGYSSLNSFSNLKVDVIKLDAMFLNFKEVDYQKGIHILESVVNMAKQISMPIIVEGVETKEQKEFLENLGCRYVQGYYFYKPLPISDFEKLVGYEKNIDKRGFVAKTNEQFRLREFLDQNVYSDTMLNSIIGAVALYSYDGKENVDIVRFNQQFYESVGVPDFSEKIIGIQKVVPDVDRPKFYELFNKAMNDRLNGSRGIIRFYRYDGTLAAFDMKYFYLGVVEGTHRFYGAANNVTKYEDLRQRMILISKYSSDSIILMKLINGKWSFVVACHGLESKTGIDLETFQNELNDRSFSKKIGKINYSKIVHAVTEGYKEKKSFDLEIESKTASGTSLKLYLEFDYVSDFTNNVEYLITIHDKK